MQNLFRRPSGVYVFRLVVPAQLRHIFGKREVITSTGTSDLTLAKILASSQATLWRQRFLDAARLAAGTNHSRMAYDDLLKIADGHPLLLGASYLSLPQAVAASGISAQDLLRSAADGRLALYCRVGRSPGYLLPIDKLELDNPELGQAGGFVLPQPHQMPSTATPHIVEGVLKVPTADVQSITAVLITTSKPASVLAFELSEFPGHLFAPNKPVPIRRENVEVLAHQVEAIRRSIAQHLSPEQVTQARETSKLALLKASATKCPHGHKLLSEALDAYVKKKLPQTVSKAGEIKRIHNGCHLLIELGGDLVVSEVTTDHLRAFRDEQLARVPARENKIRLIYKTGSVKESMTAVADTDWPAMSASERNKRMKWIESWFAWLKVGDEWIDKDPTLPLRGESVLTKKERRKLETTRADEQRKVFDADDLEKIFGAVWFQTGRGELSKKNTYRTFNTFYYWLPLLGLTLGGGRMNELCQLYLADIKQSGSGVWYVTFSTSADDQDLKNTPSNRSVPVHPLLIDLGFDKWHAALVKAGYRRLFPELKHDAEKGYGKAATKWFTTYKKRLGIPADGVKTFHSMRHNYINALPEDTPDRIGKQMSGHKRGDGVRDTRYKKDVLPDVAAKYVNDMDFPLPYIAPFDIEAGLQAIKDALQRKDKGRGAQEEAAA